MKLAIIGSRTLCIKNLESYIPDNCNEIVSGGAKGIDKNAEEFAYAHGLHLTVFLPDYARYGKGAPLRRNQEIAEYADEGIAFWDGKSRGTLYTIKLFERLNKKIEIVRIRV